ncbi:MAG: GPW/gp25 family protein [Dehalococcoidia bacterium]|nr:GPW/gp25 family protein [Dehalococcoidia bacterium]
MAKSNNETKDIIGSGWCFPLVVNGRGGIALSYAEKGVEESIQVILSTARGERHMRPGFGCGIHELVFAPNSAATWSLTAHHVREALGWWEPRIEVTDVDVRPDPTDTSRLVIDIKYRIRATNDERNLVYPFYLSR